MSVVMVFEVGLAVVAVLGLGWAVARRERVPGTIFIGRHATQAGSGRTATMFYVVLGIVVLIWVGLTVTMVALSLQPQTEAMRSVLQEVESAFRMFLGAFFGLVGGKLL